MDVCRDICEPNAELRFVGPDPKAIGTYLSSSNKPVVVIAALEHINESLANAISGSGCGLIPYSDSIPTAVIRHLRPPTSDASFSPYPVALYSLYANDDDLERLPSADVISLPG